MIKIEWNICKKDGSNQNVTNRKRWNGQAIVQMIPPSDPQLYHPYKCHSLLTPILTPCIFYCRNRHKKHVSRQAIHQAYLPLHISDRASMYWL